MDIEHNPKYHTVIEYWVRCECGWIHCTDSPEAAAEAYETHSNEVLKKRVDEIMNHMREG